MCDHRCFCPKPATRRITDWPSKWNYALNSIPILAALEGEQLADVFPQEVKAELARQIQGKRVVGTPPKRQAAAYTARYS
jgi:hypothetical protein